MSEAVEDLCFTQLQQKLPFVLNRGEPCTEILENRPAGQLSRRLNLSLMHSRPAKVPLLACAPSHPWVSTKTLSRLQTQRGLRRLEEGSWGWSTLCRDLPPITAPTAKPPAWAGGLPETPPSHHVSSRRVEMGVSQKAREILLCKASAQGVSAVGTAKCPLCCEGMDFLWERGREQSDCGDANPNCCLLLAVLCAA